MRLDGWIDVHAHFYPPESEGQRETRWQAMRQSCWCTKQPPSWDPDEILAYMDRRGIQLQLLSNIPKTLEALLRSNDYAASLVRSPWAELPAALLKASKAGCSPWLPAWACMLP